jgi:fructuronate reductase
VEYGPADIAAMQAELAGIKLGDAVDEHKVLQPILSDTGIWRTDLYEAGLGEKVEGYFTEMITGEKAVQNTLKKYIG